MGSAPLSQNRKAIEKNNFLSTHPLKLPLTKTFSPRNPLPQSPRMPINALVTICWSQRRQKWGRGWRGLGGRLPNLWKYSNIASPPFATPLLQYPPLLGFPPKNGFPKLLKPFGIWCKVGCQGARVRFDCFQFDLRGYIWSNFMTQNCLHNNIWHSFLRNPV